MPFGKGRMEPVKIGGRMIGRAPIQPGWKWSEFVESLVKSKSCEFPHFQYFIRGTMRGREGIEKDLKPGDVSPLPTGRDAWVVGNEPVVAVDFQGMIDNAKKKSSKG